MVLARLRPRAQTLPRRLLAGLAVALSVMVVVWWGSRQAPSVEAFPAAAVALVLLGAAAIMERARLPGCALAPPALILGVAMLVTEDPGGHGADLKVAQAVAAKQALVAAMVCALAVAVLFLRCTRSRNHMYIGHLMAFVGLGVAMEVLTIAAFWPSLPEAAAGLLLPGSGVALALALMAERPHRGLRWLVSGRDAIGRQVRRQIWSVALVPLVMGGGFVFYALNGREGYGTGDLVALFSLMVWQVLLFLGLGAIRMERLARERRQAEARMERMAMHDGLTGLANRIAFDRRLREAAERARSGAQTFSLVILDVDHFKRVNDTYGHAAGDAVLRALGRGLRSFAPRGAFVARLGGEEFAMILGGETTAAKQVAHELRGWIEQCRFGGVVWNGEEIGVTASFGVSDFCPRDTVGDIYARVDRALYQAKARGRNQVAVLPRVIGGCNLAEQKRNLAAGLCGEGKCEYSRGSW